MATTMKRGMTQWTPKNPDRKPADEQLREDRITAVVVTLVVLALMALIIWLASISPVAPNPDQMFYWMP